MFSRDIHMYSILNRQGGNDPELRLINFITNTYLEFWNSDQMSQVRSQIESYVFGQVHKPMFSLKKMA